MNSAYKIFFLVTLSLWQAVCLGQNSSFTKLKNNIEELKNDAALKHASLGIYVKNITKNNIISGQNSEISLAGASVMKIFTTVAALSILGNDFKFKTTLAYSGNIDEKGILNGDIYITGGGDPTFGNSRCGIEYSMDSVYYKFYRAICNAGIKGIKGSIIADGSIFDDEIIPQHWQWDDIGNYYGAGACGLNINENLYSVVLKPGKQEGDKVTVFNIKPEISYLNLINKATTGKAGTGDNVIIYGAPYAVMRIIEGTVPSDKTELEVNGSIPDPAYFCAYSFHNFLINKNIEIDERPLNLRTVKLQKKITLPELKIIYTHFSPTLAQIVNQTNIKSINTYAEAILKMIGLSSLKEGSTFAGIKAIKDFLKSKNINIDGLIMNDGSGLSPDNRITPKLLCDIIEYAISDKQIQSEFYNSLPVAGISGSIKDNFKGTAAENNLRAKSGYMNNVRAYAGLVKNKKGEQIVFTIIINDYNDTPKEMKSKLVKIMTSIAELN